jgi:hypothetical protein
MKKKLLYLTSIVLFSAASINAQTKVWDFGNDTTNWPINAGIGNTEKVVDKLGLYPHPTNTNFGAVAVSSATFPDGYTAANRFQTNGGGAPAVASPFLPTLRYLYFTVDGPCTVKVWFRGGSTSTTNLPVDRNVFITDGNTNLSSSSNVASNLGGATIATGTVLAAGKIYIYADAANYLSKIEVTGANVTTPALSTKNFQKELDITVYAKDSKIFLSSIKSSTKVEVYTVLGALVKSAQVEGDTSLDINTGMYIVKAKSAEGEKSVKVLVK